MRLQLISNQFRNLINQKSISSGDVLRGWEKEVEPFHSADLACVWLHPLEQVEVRLQLQITRIPAISHLITSLASHRVSVR